MNESLAFNVAQLLKEPMGATRTVAIAADLARLAPDLEQPAETPVVGQMQLMHTLGRVLVQGTARGQVVLPCVRCLEPVQTPLRIDIEEIFEPTIDMATGQAITPEEEDQALWIDNHHILDLSEVMRQGALLEIPAHPLCQPDCRGLCPTCGNNLNEGPCECEPEPDARWAALSAVLKPSDQ